MDQDDTRHAGKSEDVAFEVLVDDNFHYMDESERYREGVFRSYEEALKCAMKIVEQSLRNLLEPGSSADDLMARYVMFGDDPFIRPTPDDEERFSARTYARQRAPEIVGESSK